MKKINKILSIFLTIALLFTSVPIVYAEGSATVSFSGPSKAPLGSTIEVTLNVSNLKDIPGGINTIGSKLIYESEYLQFEKSTGLASFPISFKDASKKLAGLSSDVDFNITSNSGLVKLTFKTLKNGQTTIKTEGLEVSDSKGGLVTVNNASITIEIGESEPTHPVETKSNNANLSSLSVNGYTINPTFNKNTTNYTLKVPNNVSSINVNATKEDTKATVSGTGSKALNVGSNTINITVTAEDGKTTKTYKLVVEREKKENDNPNPAQKGDATLKSLDASGYTISPQFNKNTLNYEITVPSDAKDVIINAVPTDDNSKVTIKGNTDLKEGDNNIIITVTAPDGTTKDYNIKVTKKENTNNDKLDDDATLSKLDISGFTLMPSFRKEVNVYSINVPSNITGLNVTAIPTSSKATAQISGNSGWKYGVNTVSIVVTAPNGNKNTYIINVKRKEAGNTNNPTKSGDSYLNDLIISEGTLSPKFDKDISNYEITVPYDTDKLDIKYITSNDKATVKIIGNEDLKVGEVNTIQVEVTAEDGSVRIYTINATRSASLSNNNLKSLSVNGFTLSPAFAKDILTYDIKLNADTENIDVVAIAENEKATVEIIGDKNLKVGNNTVLVKVTDEKGFTKYYQINAEKPAAKSRTIGGMGMWQFLMYLFLLLGILAIIFLLILLFRRKKDEKEGPLPQNPVSTPPTPIIDFKPEFNFGSRNGTDDDVVYSGGTLNQGNTTAALPEKEKKLIDAIPAAPYEELDNTFDYYDDTVTKDELIAAIREGVETKNAEKLKMLLKQEEINKLKKEIKRKEETRQRSDRYED